MRLNFLKYKTRSALKRNNALRVSVPWNQAKNVGVIFTIDDRNKHDHVKEFVKAMETEGKKVQVMSFLPSKKENHEFLYDFFTIQNVNVWGTITSDAVEKFTATPFDYLFCLDVNESPFMLHLLAKSKARCRVGKYAEKAKPYFEFMLEVKQDTASLIDAIRTYISKLK